MVLRSARINNKCLCRQQKLSDELRCETHSVAEQCGVQSDGRECRPAQLRTIVHVCFCSAVCDLTMNVQRTPHATTSVSVR